MSKRLATLMFCLIAAIIAAAASVMFRRSAFPYRRYPWSQLSAPQPHDSEPMPVGHPDRG